MRVLAYMVYVMLIIFVGIILAKAGILPDMWQFWAIIVCNIIMFVCGWCYK